MNITSSVTNGRGGKIHAKRGTKPKTVIGSDAGVVIMIEGDDGRTYRVELWADDLDLIGAEAGKVTWQQNA